MIIDFEGDTTRPIGERRVKRSPLRDVASMIRSLDYAVQSVLLGMTDVRGRPPGMIRPEDRPALEAWAYCWYEHVDAGIHSRPISRPSSRPGCCRAR